MKNLVNSKKVMSVGPDFYKKITGKIVKISIKKVQPGEKFCTPPCKIRLIPVGVNYYEIFLENKRKLVFFEFPEFNKDRGKNLVVGKKYEFNISRSKWISQWYTN